MKRWHWWGWRRWQLPIRMCSPNKWDHLLLVPIRDQEKDKHMKDVISAFQMLQPYSFGFTDWESPYFSPCCAHLRISITGSLASGFILDCTVVDWNIYVALSCRKARQVEWGRTLAFKELVCSWKMRCAHMIIRQDKQSIWGRDRSVLCGIWRRRKKYLPVEGQEGDFKEEIASLWKKGMECFPSFVYNFMLHA